MAKAKSKAEAKSAPEAESKSRPRYAVVDAKGLQVRVTKDEEIILPNLNEEPGAELTFDRVLLVSDGASVQVGTPLVEGAVVMMQVLGPERGRKIRVGTYKRRKKYRRKIGYRDTLTRVKILGINLSKDGKRGSHGA